MDSPPPILRAGLLDGVGVTGNAEDAIARCRALGAVDGPGTLVHRAAPPRDADGARAALDDAWDAIRAHALPPEATGRLIVLIAPPPGDAHRDAARAGLENLARTLSIEWARHGTRTVAILPGADTADAEVAELTAFLASRAGAYYSGCAFSLR